MADASLDGRRHAAPERWRRWARRQTRGRFASIGAHALAVTARPAVPGWAPAGAERSARRTARASPVRSALPPSGNGTGRRPRPATPTDTDRPQQTAPRGTTHLGALSHSGTSGSRPEVSTHQGSRVLSTGRHPCRPEGCPPWQHQPRRPTPSPPRSPCGSTSTSSPASSYRPLPVASRTPGPTDARRHGAITPADTASAPGAPTLGSGPLTSKSRDRHGNRTHRKPQDARRSGGRYPRTPPRGALSAPDRLSRPSAAPTPTHPEGETRNSRRGRGEERMPCIQATCPRWTGTESSRWMIIIQISDGANRGRIR